MEMAAAQAVKAGTDFPTLHLAVGVVQAAIAVLAVLVALPHHPQLEQAEQQALGELVAARLGVTDADHSHTVVA